MSTSPTLSNEAVTRLHQVEHWRHWFRIALFLLLYICGAVGAIFLVSQVHWAAAIPFYLLAGASLHGISLFAHEAVHGTLGKNAIWNRIAGAACAIPVLQNCSAYRVLHLRHHKHLGDDGDPDHYPNYTRWSWMVFCMNWLRLLIGYPVYIFMIPILGFRQGTHRDKVGILAEMGVTALIIGGVLFSSIPLSWIIHGWLVPMLFINTMVNIRGMSQHTLLGNSDDEVLGTRSILTSRVISFFMCNENYHLEHHLYPGVPWYHLAGVHSELAEELRDRGAPYIGSYSAFVLEFASTSLRLAPWKSGPVLKDE